MFMHTNACTTIMLSVLVLCGNRTRDFSLQQVYLFTTEPNNVKRNNKFTAQSLVYQCSIKLNNLFLILTEGPLMSQVQ